MSLKLWVTRGISGPSHQHPLTPYRMPFPSLHRNDASHQASLLTSPYGFHLNIANSLKRREICQMLHQDCVDFLWRLSLFYSSFIMLEFFFFLYVCLGFKLTWTQEVKCNGKELIWFAAHHTTERKIYQKQMRERTKSAHHVCISRWLLKKAKPFAGLIARDVHCWCHKSHWCQIAESLNLEEQSRWERAHLGF